MKYLILIFTLVFANCAVLNSLSTSSESLNSISTSLNSISTALNSVSSISKSLASVSTSSNSEDDEKKKALYIRDVESITYLFLNQKISSWEENLQDIAYGYGYLSWKETPTSFVGIGKGLRKAGLSENEFETFLKRLSGSSTEVFKLLKQGYRE